MTGENQDYYSQRARQERERAATCNLPEVARIHLELASLYEQRMADPAAWEKRSTQKMY
jgi:hypothetical protein